MSQETRSKSANSQEVGNNETSQWLTNRHDVHAIWSGDSKLLWHKRVHRDETNKIIAIDREKLVMTVRRCEGRLFVLELKEVYDSITEDAAWDKLYAKTVVPVGAEGEEDVLTKTDYHKPFLFKGLDKSMVGSYVATLRLVEVDEHDHFRAISGVLRDGCLTVAQLVQAEDAGEWKEDNQHIARPPPVRIEANKCADSAEMPAEEDAKDDASPDDQAPQLQRVTKVDGHISYSKKPGVTIGDDVALLSNVVKASLIKDATASSADAEKASDKQKNRKRTFREAEEEDGLVLVPEPDEREPADRRKRRREQQEEWKSNSRARARTNGAKMLRKTRASDQKTAGTGDGGSSSWLTKGLGIFGYGGGKDKLK